MLVPQFDRSALTIDTLDRASSVGTMNTGASTDETDERTGRTRTTRTVTGAVGVSSAARPGVGTPARSTCANCGADLSGRYCAQCGQDSRDVDGTLVMIATLTAGAIFLEAPG
jgi:hypothetical protein